MLPLLVFSRKQLRVRFLVLHHLPEAGRGLCRDRHPGAVQRVVLEHDVVARAQPLRLPRGLQQGRVCSGNKPGPRRPGRRAGRDARLLHAHQRQRDVGIDLGADRLRLRGSGCPRPASSDARCWTGQRRTRAAARGSFRGSRRAGHRQLHPRYQLRRASTARHRHRTGQVVFTSRAPHPVRAKPHPARAHRFSPLLDPLQQLLQPVFFLLQVLAHLLLIAPGNHGLLALLLQLQLPLVVGLFRGLLVLLAPALFCLGHLHHVLVKPLVHGRAKLKRNVAVVVGGRVGGGPCFTAFLFLQLHPFPFLLQSVQPELFVAVHLEVGVV
mmetsp:Transcript_28710/g.72709  ORF Transcript_28710/g.72709 Transcript_28710/m.72709 type:complete len:325 (-) Transcript_28710:2618-3592(-)